MPYGVTHTKKKYDRGTHNQIVALLGDKASVTDLIHMEVQEPYCHSVKTKSGLTPRSVQTVSYQEGMWYGSNGEELEIRKLCSTLLKIRITYEVPMMNTPDSRNRGGSGSKKLTGLEETMLMPIPHESDISTNELITHFPVISKSLVPLMCHPNETLHQLGYIHMMKNNVSTGFRRQYVVQAGGSDRPQMIVIEDCHVFDNRDPRMGRPQAPFLVSLIMLFLIALVVVALVLIR